MQCLFFFCSLIHFHLLLQVTADIFLAVGLRHLREWMVYTGVLYPKEIAQGPRNHSWLRHFFSSGDGF